MVSYPGGKVRCMACVILHLTHADTCFRPRFSRTCPTYCSYLTRHSNCQRATICLSQHVRFETCQNTQRNTSPSMLCSLFYSKQLGVTRKGRERKEGSAKGNSTHNRRETDGLCMGYLQPVGEWGNLALVAETMKNTARAHSQKTMKCYLKSCMRIKLKQCFEQFHKVYRQSYRAEPQPVNFQCHCRQLSIISNKCARE